MSVTPAWIRAASKEAQALDVAVYAAVAATPTPTLDPALQRLSAFADHSKLWLAVAAALAAAGGARGAGGGGYRAAGHRRGVGAHQSRPEVRRAAHPPRPRRRRGPVRPPGADAGFDVVPVRAL